MSSLSSFMTTTTKNRKQTYLTTTTETDKVCSFCTQRPIALIVKLPVVGHTKKRAATPYCLSCYYTSSASRQDPIKYVSVVNVQEQQRQLPAIQTMFSECFLELQQDISKESVEAFSRQKHDPLAAMLMTTTSSAKPASKRKSPGSSAKRIFDQPNKEKKKAGNARDGGFLRDVEVPERLKKTQQQQARVQHQQLARMVQTPSSAGISDKRRSSAARRKGSGKSIWNLAMALNAKSTPVANHKTNDNNEEENLHGVSCTSCGSNDVQSFGNITSRNGDVRKGEIWGTDRDASIVTKYQCNQCGRTWNEEE